MNKQNKFIKKVDRLSTMGFDNVKVFKLNLRINQVVKMSVSQYRDLDLVSWSSQITAW